MLANIAENKDDAIKTLSIVLFTIQNHKITIRKNESATRKEFNKHIEMAMGSEKSRIEMEKILNKINQRFSTSLKISDFKDATT